MAFWELSTDRQLAMGAVGPIPASSIDRWAARYPGEEAAFRSAIRAMDRAFLAQVNNNADPSERPKESMPSLTPDAFKRVAGG